MPIRYFRPSSDLPGGRGYWWLALAGLALLLASTYHRLIHTDDAWIGEQVWWMARWGYVRSELFRGYLHAEVYQEVYHKLFVWQAALVVRLLGWSVYILKGISLAYLALFCWLAGRYLRQLPVPNPGRAAGLFFALLLTSALVAEFSFVFRPELMLLTLGFGSWLALRRALPGAGLLVDAVRPTGAGTTQPAGTTQLAGTTQPAGTARLAGTVMARPAVAGLGAAAGAGLLAGLALLTHLNGLIFVLAGGALLLWRRRWLAALAFGGAAALAGAAYFADVARHHSWALYWQQLHPAVAENSPRLGERLLYLLAEHQRFFHSPKEIVLSLLLLLAAYVLYRQRARLGPEPRHLATYTGLLVLALDLIAQGKTSKYLLLYLPQLLLLVVLAFEYLAALPRLRPVALGLLGLYVVVNLTYTSILLSEQRAQQHENRQLAERLRPHWGQHVVAPVNFIFPAIAHFQLQGATYYFMLASEREQHRQPFDFFATVAQQHFPLLILDPEALHELHLPTPTAPGQRFGPYRFTFADHEHYVYEAEVF